MSGKGGPTGKQRKHPGVAGRRPDLKAKRQAEAIERQAKSDAKRTRKKA